MGTISSDTSYQLTFGVEQGGISQERPAPARYGAPDSIANGERTGRYGRVAPASHSGAIANSETDEGWLLTSRFLDAIATWNPIDMRAIEAAAFASVVDGFSFGLILVDEHRIIVHANPVAALMLSERDPIESKGGVLSMPSRPAHEALARAVYRAKAGNTAFNPGVSRVFSKGGT
jgi:PAS domain-containing protein